MEKHSDKGNLISFNCILTNTSPGFLSNFVCENKTDERIYIEWENSRMKDDRIIFGDDTRVSMRDPKVDEAVSPHGKSIVRKIASMEQVRPDLIASVFSWKREKELMKDLGQKESIDVKMSVRFMDNHVEEYVYVYSIWYEMPTE